MLHLATSLIDADFTAFVTDVTSYFTSVKGFVTAVVVFGIVISITKMLKKR